MKRRGEFSLHQSNFTSDGQHLEVLRVTSGGSRRRECPLPKKLPPFGHGPRDFWALPKSYGYFSGAQNSVPPCGFAVLVIPGKKAGFAPTGAVCRSCTTMPVSIRVPHPEGKAFRLSRLSSIRRRHLAGRGAGAKRPARSRGAKSRNAKGQACSRSSRSAMAASTR